MKKLIALVVACGFGSAALAFPNLSSLLYSHHDFEVIADGDVLPEGKALPRPTPDKPLYYMAVAAGYHDFGKAIAGEKPPREKDMIKVITSVLDKQGYKLATNKNPPQVIIVYSWGTMNPSVWQAPGRSQWEAAQPGTISGPNLVFNRANVIGFLGYGKSVYGKNMNRDFPQLASGLSIVNDRIASMLELGALNYHAIALSAFDYDAARHNQAKLLWRTHVASPSLGFDMFDALPKMAAIAGPHIGRQTYEPIHILASDHYRPDVNIGEPSVVPERD